MNRPHPSIDDPSHRPCQDLPDPPPDPGHAPPSALPDPPPDPGKEVTIYLGETLLGTFDTTRARIITITIGRDVSISSVP